MPYYLIVAAYAVTWGEVPWASVFLVGNFGVALPEEHGMVPYLYWFIEAYCQMMLVFVGLFAIPQFRRFVSARPFGAGMALLFAALVARLTLPLLWPIGNRQIFTLPWIFYLAVIGWCAAVAETGKQRLLLMLSGAGAFLFFGLYEGSGSGRRSNTCCKSPSWQRCFILRASACRAGRRSSSCLCRRRASTSTSCTASFPSC